MEKEISINEFLRSQTFKEFFSIAWSKKYVYFSVILIRTVLLLLSLGWAEANRKLFNEINGLTIQFCISIVSILLCIKLTSMFMEYIRDWIMSFLNESVVNKMRWLLLSKSVFIPYSFYEETHSSRLYKVFFTDLEEVKELLVYKMLDLICLPLSFIGIGAYLFTIHPLLGFIAIIVGPLQLISNLVKLKDFKFVIRQLNDFDYKFFLTMEEAVNGIREIKENMMEKETIKNFDELCEIGLKLDVKKVKIEAQRNMIKNLPSEMAYIIGLIAVFYLMLQGKIEIGGFVAFTLLLSVVTDVFNNIVRVITQLHATISNTKDLCTIMEKEKENLDVGHDLEEKALSLKFVNVNFSYGNGHPVLKNLNFNIPAGSTVAIVGPSGGGKSTIIKLIQCFYRPTAGEIYVNDQPISNYKLGKLRTKIAVVPQDIFLYATTIEGNIAIANTSASKQEIEYAAKMADSHNFILEMPEKYNTEVGQRGIKLSQGQKQRIGISRALLKKASLVVLDEATSALDVETEDTFQNNFKDWSKDCTKIIIAHRLATIKEADYVIFIENGTAVEQGTLDELLSSNSRFSDYWNKQVNIVVKV